MQVEEIIQRGQIRCVRHVQKMKYGRLARISEATRMETLKREGDIIEEEKVSAKVREIKQEEARHIARDTKNWKENWKIVPIQEKNIPKNLMPKGRKVQNKVSKSHRTF